MAFPRELLCHTKGAFRRQRFELLDWQEHEVFRPLFGEVLWSVEWGRYVRRYRRAVIVMARKNGKSQIAAAIQLILFVGDDEEEAEVYQGAKDRDQAAKVFGPALRMVQLSPTLSRRLVYNKAEMRLSDEKTGSTYQVITSDATGELGHNPHGYNLDEFLAQPDGAMWAAMDTADGTRCQELLFATSTETDDDSSFGAHTIDEAERVQENPARSPHTFVFIRKLPRTDAELARLHRLYRGHPHLPVSTDPHDERNWRWPNPGLGQFKSVEAMRRQSHGARTEPRKLKAFLQFQCNQRVQELSTYIDLDLWDANIRELWPTPTWGRDRLRGQRCWGGLDLSSKLDLTAWSLRFDDGTVLWRFWVPESMVAFLDERTDGDFGRWCEAGWVTVTDGDVIDYDAIVSAIAEDATDFAIVDATYDKWMGENTRQSVQKVTDLVMVESSTTYDRMTGPMTEFTRALTAREYAFLGNPVARWMAANLRVKFARDDPDRVRPVKPERGAAAVRIDGMVTLFMAEDGHMRVTEDTTSIYERRGLSTVG